jgi:dihydrofolate reductase
MINALFAVDQYGGMGFNGTLPWLHNSEDLANFRQLTSGHVVVMGRRTYDDPKMPKPLVDRTVYVVSNRLIADSVYQISGNINEELLEIEKRYPDKTIWVIGGANLLEQCDGIFDKLYLTHFKGSYKIDTKLNLKSFLSGWNPIRATAPANNNCTFVIYENIFKRSKSSTE